LVIEGGGFSIVADLYTPRLAGLEPPTEPADAALTSSALDEAHSNAAGVPGSARILHALDTVDRPVTVGVAGSTITIEPSSLPERRTIHAPCPAHDPRAAS
jgi:hypothetical protein